MGLNIATLVTDVWLWIGTIALVLWIWFDFGGPRDGGER